MNKPKYRFKCCECGWEPKVIHFTADYFLNPCSELLDYISHILWEVGLDGVTVQSPTLGTWPPELSKSYFNSLAKAYGRKLLSGQRNDRCAECDNRLEITRL